MTALCRWFRCRRSVAWLLAIVVQRRPQSAVWRKLMGLADAVGGNVADGILGQAGRRPGGGVGAVESPVQVSADEFSFTNANRPPCSGISQYELPDRLRETMVPLPSASFIVVAGCSKYGRCL